MFKRVMLAGAALAVLTGGAFAADLGAPMSPPPMMAPPGATTNWDGPYIGASVGYGWGTATAAGAPTTTASPAGFLIAGQVGYNIHLTDIIVAGIEGDIGWNDQQANFGVPASTSYRINWDGSVRGRLGYDAGPFLPYVEAGVAFANATAAGTGGSASATHTGWVAGVGVEYMISDQLSANLEFRYADYGSQNYQSTPVSLTDSTVRVGLNYHF